MIEYGNILHVYADWATRRIWNVLIEDMSIYTLGEKRGSRMCSTVDVISCEHEFTRFVLTETGRPTPVDVDQKIDRRVLVVERQERCSPVKSSHVLD